MRSAPGQTDLDESRGGGGGASQRTSGELSSQRRNHDSPGFATDDQRPLIYIIPAIIAGLVLIIAGAIAVMYLWKRRQQRHNLGKKDLSNTRQFGLVMRSIASVCLSCSCSNF